jgi:hypothetical protein
MLAACLSPSPRGVRRKQATRQQWLLRERLTLPTMPDTNAYAGPTFASRGTWGWQRRSARTTHRAIWDHHRHTNLVRIASSLRADVIFGKDTRRRSSCGARARWHAARARRLALTKTENLPLADQGCDNHLSFIEFRPNDLASPRIARLTDNLLPKISN